MKPNRLKSLIRVPFRGTLLSLVLAAFGQLTTALAQDNPGADSSPDPGTPSVLPRPDFHFPGNVGRTYLDSDPPAFPQVTRPPKGAPNLLLILLDDVGFGQFSAFGGGVPSPAIEKLAARGLRYTRFHTTALCSPTRAALLTGRDHHLAGTGVITELATGYDGYTGIIPKSAGTVSEILRQNGYATAWIGKNHNTPAWETSEVGPFDHWPSGLGFDYFYGFNSGDTSQFEPVLFENHNRVPRSSDPNYHISHDLADHAIAWMQREKEIDPARPFFLYIAPSATHSPHMAPKEWIEKFKGQFDMGWDRYREMTLERQKKLGVVPANTKLTPLVALPEGSAPDLKNKSFTITAEVDIPSDGGDGMIFTQGGITAGWGFYLLKGKLVGLHNYLGIERYRAVSTLNVPTGKTTLTFDFKYDGGGMGNGGTITLLANGKKLAEARAEKTAGFKYSLYEGQDIGEDSGSPVDFDHTPPFRFSGKIEKVTLDLK